VRRPAALYALLALAVAGPLLGPGVVLAVDLAQVPHQGLPGSYAGLPVGTHEGPPSRLPLDALFALLGSAGLAAAGQKLLLLAIVFLAGWGMHRLVRARGAGGAGAAYAGVLYAINPFVYDRLLTGQWFLLLGYALLPLALDAWTRALAGRGALAPWRFAALAAAVGAASAHMAVLLAVLCAATAVTGRERGAARRAALAAGLALAASLYWLLPTPGANDFLAHIDAGQLDLYATVPQGGAGLAPTVLGLLGYWNNAEPLSAYVPFWPLLALTFLALASQGAVLRRRDRLTWGVAAAGVLGFLLALGHASALTRPAFDALMEHVAPLRGLRESQKGVALVAFAYAFLGGPAVDEATRAAAGRRLARAALAAVLVAVPAAYGFRLAGGLHGELGTSAVPASWSAADRVLRDEASGSRTLFLPWHGYFAHGFAQHRVVANLAPAFFSTPILASRSVGEGAEHEDASDPAEARVAALLAGGPRPGLARGLAALGVSHVLLAREADWGRWRFLERAPGFAVERRWRGLTLLRLRRPGGLIMTRDGGPLPVRRLSATHLRLDARAPAGVRLGLPAAGRWRVDGRDVRYAPWAAYRRNYLLGALALLLVAAGAATRRPRSRRAPRPSARPASRWPARPPARRWRPRAARDPARGW
jgi:hypothetical protein